MRIRKQSVLSFGLIFAVTCAVQAQDPRPPQPGLDSAPSRPVSQETVEKFASVYREIQDIQQDYTQKMQEAGNREEAQQLQQGAQEEMLAAVQDSGLSAQQYNDMIGRMEQDAELRQRVFAIMVDETN